MLYARWITMARPECSIWKRTNYTDARVAAYKDEVELMPGSYLFGKNFRTEGKPVSATLSVCGLGYYEITINGEKPDPARVLAPVFSDYFHLCRYDTYDVTALLQAGENNILAEVAEGWFAPGKKYWGWQYQWNGDSRLIAELTLTYADGATETVATDDTWLWAPGTVLSSDIYDGETVDFNRTPKAEDWKNAVLAEEPTENLVKAELPPIRIIRTLKPVAVRQLSPTEWVYDFGENHSGMSVIRAIGKKGDRVITRHAEFAHEDGTPDYGSQGAALSTDTYTLSEEECVCAPRFTWHGYRYMRLEISSPDVKILGVESRMIHSDVKTTGTFTCDNEKLNHLHEVCLRSEKNCLMGLPLDCNQRHERKAWLGDAHVTAELCMYNFDMRTLYAALMEDIRLDCEVNISAPFLCPHGHPTRTASANDNTKPTTSLDWSVAYPIILMEHAGRYKDIELLKRNLPALKRHIDFYTVLEKDGILPEGWFGDWFSVDYPTEEKMMGFKAGSEDHRQNPPYLATVFFCQTLRLVSDIARLCGEEDYAEKLMKDRERYRAALCKRCYHKDTGKFGSGGQFLSTIVLSEGLVEKEDEPKVFAELLSSLEAAEYHPLVGVVGMRLIFDVLAKFGRRDIAYKVLTVEGYPGMFDMAGHDRTTFTEGQNGGGSGCHCMFASPDGTLYKMLAGITFNRLREIPIAVEPYFPEGLNEVRATQELEEGTLSVEWKRTAEGVRLTVRVPAGLSAAVTLPGKAPELLTGEKTFIA